jgi:hypothetical protein
MRICNTFAGPRQHSDSWFQVPRDSWPCLLLSNGSGRLQSPPAFPFSFFMVLIKITWPFRVWKDQFGYPNSHSTWSSALPSRERRQPWEGVVLLQALRRKAEAVGWQIKLMHLPLCSSVCVCVCVGQPGWKWKADSVTAAAAARRPWIIRRSCRPLSFTHLCWFCPTFSTRVTELDDVVVKNSG